MKIKLFAIALAALFLVPVSDASATWFMRYGQAKNESKRFSKESCERSQDCTAWGAGKCVRRSQSSFSCVIANWFLPPNSDEPDIECVQVLHWGVKTGGFIVLKNAGEPRCH
jgi:hypothetical protein